MTIRLYCSHCRAKRQHRGNGVSRMICEVCRRYRDLPEGKGATEVYHMEMSDREPSPIEKDRGRRARRLVGGATGGECAEVKR
jgi:hypothetical protein